MISKALGRIQFSTTMEVAAKAIELKESGIDLIDLSVGEPDFPTPQHIKDAAKNALDNNFTKYTTNKGTLQLREAIANKLKRDNQLDYNPEHIIVSTGAKQALFNSIQTLVDDGDEVIIPSPTYISYIQMVKFAGGDAKVIRTSEDNKFKFDIEELKNAVNKKTKLLLLCNPCNPTGTVYTRHELNEIAEVVLRNNLFIVCDDIYEKLIYDNLEFTSIASFSDEIKKRTIVVNGFSKAYSMTGWRIGYAAGEQQIINNMAKLQSHSTSCTSSISQAAALAALNSDQSGVEMMRKEFESRRNFIYDEINKINGFSANKPQGAFYIFPNISGLIGKSLLETIRTSKDLALYLLESANVAVVPGSGFESEGFIRISFASSSDNLAEGIRRINAAVNKLS